MRKMLWAALALSGAVACGPGTNPSDASTDGDASMPLPATYANVQAIYNTSCAIGSSCHNGPGGPGGVDLSAAGSHAATVGRPSTQVPRLQMVQPNQPESSYLYLKLTDAYRMQPECMANPTVCGTRMPMVGGQPLDDASRDLIRRWILAGAPSM